MPAYKEWTIPPGKLVRLVVSREGQYPYLFLVFNSERKVIDNFLLKEDLVAQFVRESYGEKWSACIAQNKRTLEFWIGERVASCWFEDWYYNSLIIEPYP